MWYYRLVEGKGATCHQRLPDKVLELQRSRRHCVSNVDRGLCAFDKFRIDP